MSARAAGTRPREVETGIRKSVTVRRPADEVYAIWSDIGGLPAYLEHVENVAVRHDGTSHWVVVAPNGLRAEWDATFARDAGERTILWKSESGGRIQHEGSVRFEDGGDKATVIRLDMTYKAPGGLFDAALRSAVESLVDQDLESFRRRMDEHPGAADTIPTEMGMPPDQPQAPEKAPKEDRKAVTKGKPVDVTEGTSADPGDAPEQHSEFE